MSYTPGPWQAGRSDMATIVDGYESKWIYAGNTYVAVASGVMLEWDEVIANAHLIAAAPDLLKVAEAYEAWEADLVTCDESWAPNGMAEFPRLTESQYDRILEIQAMRNHAVAKAKGGTQ